MKLGGQGIFDNAVFLVGTSVRKSTFLKLYKTKDHELSNSAFVLRSSRWIELLGRLDPRGRNALFSGIKQWRWAGSSA